MLNKIKGWIEEIKPYKNVYVVGNGLREQALAKFLGFCGINVKNFLAFEKRKGLKIKTKSPYTALFMNKKDSVLLYESQYDYCGPLEVQTGIIEIEKDCKKTKDAVKWCRNFNRVPIVVFKYNEMNQIQRKMTPKKPEKFGLELHLADHCNLRCQMCTHFSPIAKEGYYDIKQYENDIKRLGELFQDKIGYLDLMGGEPLLNDNIIEYLKITRKYFPTSDIFVHSNGVLMLQAEHFEKGNFWQACKDYNIKLFSTKYPINVDYDAIQAKAKEYGVELILFVEAADREKDCIKVSSKEPLDLEGKTDKSEFIVCYRLNMCTNLKDGKIYPCPTVAYINSFNDFFGKDLKVTEDDYIDIYKAKSAEEICEFVTRRIPFCDHCRYSQATYCHPWKASTKQISEWVIDEQANC